MTGTSVKSAGVGKAEWLRIVAPKNPDSPALGETHTRRTALSSCLHPLLFALYPIASLYLRNLESLHPGVLVVPLAATLIGVLLLLALLLRFSKRPQHAAIVLSASILYFYFADYVLGIRRRLPTETLNAVTTALQFGLCFALTALTGIVVYRRTALGRPLTQAVNFTASVLFILPPLFAAPRLAGQVREQWHDAPVKRAGSETPTDSERWAERPDFYVLLLDEYGRNDVLQTCYGHDNTDFTAALEKRGFRVAARSYANYPYTQLAVPTLLNLDYVLSSPEVSKRWSRIARSISDARIFSILKDRGYSILTFPPGLTVLDRHLSKYEADNEALRTLYVSDFIKLLLRRTPLGGIDWNQRHSDVDRILRNLDLLPEIARRPEPTFVFMHLLAPHEPFMFQADGTAREKTVRIRPKPWNQEGYDHFRQHYAEEVAGLNVVLLDALDRLLAASPEPPVILVMGDHGPRPDGYNRGWDWAGEQVLGPDGSIGAKTRRPGAGTPAFLKEWMGILHAAYLPGQAEGFHDSISPVNSLRLVCSAYLGLDLPPLPDRSFFTPDTVNDSREIHAVEITSRLKQSTAPTSRGER